MCVGRGILSALARVVLSTLALAAFPLNDYVLNVKSSDRQDTGPARKLFSHEVATMIRIVHPNDETALEIADFCETMSDSMWDCNHGIDS